jgi:hypothetical protein
MDTRLSALRALVRFWFQGLTAAVTHRIGTTTKENTVFKKNLLAISVATVDVDSQARGQSSAQQPANASAQSSVDQDIDLIRKDVRSQKKQIIAANLQLTDAEAVKFWPPGTSTRPSWSNKRCKIRGY